MTANLIIYSIFSCFAGIIISAALSLHKKSFGFSSIIFILSNILGFFGVVSFLIYFPSETITLGFWDGFFHFYPRLNLLSAIFFALISGVSALVGVYSARYLELYKKTYDPQITQSLTACFVLGMLGVILANNSFGFLFFWEVMSVASFFLVMASRTEASVRSAFKYFIMTHLGAAALMGGFLILGGGNLVFDFANIGVASQNLSTMLASVAFVLFFFGFGSKAGLVPFHVWLPEAHPEAPSNVSAMMSGLMLKVAVFGFIKVIFSFIGLPSWAGIAIIILGLLSAFVGALYAVIERDIKRTFAYSSIENMGIIFTMLGVAVLVLSKNISSGALAIAYATVVFAIFHTANHALFKTALFLSSGVVISRCHSRRLEFMGGLAKIAPIFSFAFLIAILGSLPLAPFGTFFGEWGLVQNAIKLMHISELGTNTMVLLVAVLAIIGLVSGLAIFAMIKVFGISMLGLSRSKHMEIWDEKKDYAMIFPILALGAGVLGLGFFAKNLISWLSFNAGNMIGNSSELFIIKNSQLSSSKLFLTLFIFLTLSYVFKKIFVKEKLEREYVTWDCGQAIDSSMQYTATAFSAPIRFFFLSLIGRNKSLASEAVVATNPWIRKFTFSMTLSSIWDEAIYVPISNVLNFFANKARAIQGGRIQYYLLFVLGTLIVALILFL